jgi:hypothetical protein
MGDWRKLHNEEPHNLWFLGSNGGGFDVGREKYKGLV